MKKLWLIGILIVSLFFLACSGQFETTLSLAEDEEVSGGVGSYNYYLHVTQIDKKNSFCYLDAYLSSSANPSTEQIVLDKETPVKISGFTASLIGIRESFTGDKCLIKVSNKRETTKITGAAARAPPPKPRTATTPAVTIPRTTSATPAQPAATPRATPAQPATSSRATPATPSLRASSVTATTPSRTGAPTAAPRAETPTVPATPTPHVTTTPASRTGTPVTTTPSQTTSASRAGAPTTVPQPAAGGRAATTPVSPTTAGRTGTATPAQPITGGRTGASTQPATAAPRASTATNVASPDRTSSTQSTLAVSECADKIDNDNDGLTDWPNDPDCTDRKGTSEGVKQESLTTTLPQCSDGIDNDGDGLIDYDQELFGCETTEDNDETDVAVATDTSLLKEEVSPAEETVTAALPEALQCADGIDNDGDGLTDYVGGDPGCSGEADSSEEDYIPPQETSGGGGTSAPSAPAPLETPSVPEAPLEELPPEEQPTEEKKSEAQQTVAESTAMGKAEKTIERLTKGETIVVDTSHIIPEIKSVEMTARKEVQGASFKIEKTEKSAIPIPTLKNVISTFHIEGPESDKVIDIKVELSKYTAKTTANCFDTKHNKWRPGKVKEKKSDEKYVYLKVALPCRN